MRARRWAAIAAACLLLAGCSAGGSSKTPSETTTAAWKVDCPHSPKGPMAKDFDITLPCLSGGADYRLGATDGKPMVISLWASWCGPCRTEAPALATAQRELGDRLRVIGVDSQDGRDAAVSFADEAKWRFPSVADRKGQVMRDRGLTTLPAIFLVDADGVTVHTIRDSDLTSKELLSAIAKRLKVRP